MRTLLGCMLALVVGEATASADGVAEEVSAGSAPHAQGEPSSRWLADKLTGIWDPSDAWQLRLELTGTRYLDGEAGDVLLGNLGVEYDPDDHWVLRLTGGGSPPSTTASTIAVQPQRAGAETPGSAQVETTSSSISGAAWLGYETAGDGDVETSVIASATVTRLTTQPQLTASAGRGQAVTPDQLRALCAANPCAPVIAAALEGRPTSLLQLVIGGGVSEQLYHDTDVGLDGAYYVYDKDPTQLGTSAVTRSGAATSAGGSVGLAPVRYSVTPSVIHRFGVLMVMSSASYSKYVDDQGDELAATLRLQVKLALAGDRQIKLWTKLTGARDVDQMHGTSRAGSATLGVQYSW